MKVIMMYRVEKRNNRWEKWTDAETRQRPHDAVMIGNDCDLWIELQGTSSCNLTNSIQQHQQKYQLYMY